MIAPSRPIIFKRAIGIPVMAFLFFIAGNAQVSKSRHRENFDVRRYDVKTIAIIPQQASAAFSNVSNIIVLDARADTGRVGLMQKKVVSSILSGNERYDKQKITRDAAFLDMNSGLQKEAGLFANDYLHLHGESNLPGVLMVIKKLWLSDELNIGEEQEKRIAKTEIKELWTSGADIKVEFYLKFEEGYYALCRFDSVINKALTISEYGSEYLSLAIRASLDKLATMGSKIEAGVGARRKFSLEEIKKHNEDAYNMPVLTDSVLHTGVYMTFEEFKNNAPSIPEYKLKKERLTDFLYVKQVGGNEVVERNAWGYCNGKNAFIRAGDNYFLLQQIENAFYIVGTKNIKWEKGPVVPIAAPVPLGILVGAARFDGYMVNARPLQLDWSTGKLY